jgi:hypothetical protein
LIATAPSDRDLRSIVQIDAEEMRHGWQMSYLLARYFGDDGKAEARKLLERRADRKERILGVFNQAVEDWFDFSRLPPLSTATVCISSRCSAISDCAVERGAWGPCSMKSRFI